MSGMRITGGVGLVALLVWQPTAGAQAPRPAPGVTFTKDVAPIFNANCVVCHQPGEIAPMSLMTYEAARPWARSIRKAVADRVMPPWHADPQHRRVRQRSAALGQGRRDHSRLGGWRRRAGRREGSAGPGAAEGRVEDRDARPGALDARAGAKCRQRGTRIIQDYAIEPVVFNEDRYVERIEVIPSNRLVTHHAILSVRDGNGSQRLGGYQPGGVTTDVSQRASCGRSRRARRSG